MFKTGSSPIDAILVPRAGYRPLLTTVEIRLIQLGASNARLSVHFMSQMPLCLIGFIVLVPFALGSLFVRTLNG
jgi:hypothetical protein